MGEVPEPKKQDLQHVSDASNLETGLEPTIDCLASESALCAALQGDVARVRIHLGSQLIALGLSQRRDVVPGL